jgi:hypothetical protein
MWRPGSLRPVLVAFPFFLAAALAACESDMNAPDGATSSSGGDSGEGGSSSSGEPGSDAGSSGDAAPPGVLSIVGPSAGAELLYSAWVRLAAPAGVDSVEVSSGATTCVARAPVFECLLDVSAAPVGPLTLTATSKAADGKTLDTASVQVARREVTVPCSGTPVEITQCIEARATAGTAAGFAGTAYINADNGHTGCERASSTPFGYAEPPPTLPAGVTLGVMHESTGWTPPSGGICSLTRCNPFARRFLALQYYEAGVLYFHPEVWDVGTRDYFQWQAPYFVVSQGSSGSECDEVSKTLRAFGAMSSDVRSVVVNQKLGGPLGSFLITRSRQATDVAYLTAEAWPTALADLDNEERIVTLATALRAAELPPVAKLAVAAPSFPAEWQMVPVLESPYALGYAPGATPPAAPAGNFQLEVDLKSSVDPNARALGFFPVVLRGGPDVTVERTGTTTFRVRGAFPVDATVATGGQQRIVSRTTVAFFPHNGVWLGTPAMVSVGARTAEVAAPFDNNLD